MTAPHVVGTLADEDKYFYNEEHGLPIITSLFRAHLGRDVLEIGAGTGAIARWLVDEGAHVTAVEPEPILARRIRAKFADVDDVRVIEADSVGAHAALVAEGRTFDTVLCVSVLEHIADDRREFAMAASMLRPGGHYLVFVPAMPLLYARIDRETGHVRRYTKRRFRELCRGAGLEVVSLRYFEVLGILPYLVVYKFLRRASITSSSTGVYNNVILPLSALLDKVLRGRLIGKNLVLVARRP